MTLSGKSSCGRVSTTIGGRKSSSNSSTLVQGSSSRTSLSFENSCSSRTCSGRKNIIRATLWCKNSRKSITLRRRESSTCAAFGCKNSSSSRLIYHSSYPGYSSSRRYRFGSSLASQATSAACRNLSGAVVSYRGRGLTTIPRTRSLTRRKRGGSGRKNIIRAALWCKNSRKSITLRRRESSTCAAFGCKNSSSSRLIYHSSYPGYSSSRRYRFGSSLASQATSAACRNLSGAVVSYRGRGLTTIPRTRSLTRRKRGGSGRK